MTTYNHGIRVKEGATPVSKPLLGTAGLQVVVGCAPVNLTKDPYSKTNKVVLCNSFDECVQKLGYSDEMDKYTLCQVVYASFKHFKISPVVFINVLDPKKHKQTVAESTVNVVNKQAIHPDTGILLDKLVVKNAAATLVADTDYILSFNDEGKAVISLLSTGSAYNATQLKVSGEKIDPSLVTVNDIVGGYSDSTGESTGIELIKSVFPKLGIVPGTLLAPGYSYNPLVATALVAKCEELNGKFRAMALIDISSSTVKKYTDVPKAKADLGIKSPFAIGLWPSVKVEKKVISYSAMFGALCAYIDTKNDNIPSKYPSNKLLNVESACLADGNEVLIDEEQGNTLNAVGVVTVINQVGLRAWGNNTMAYPDDTDPKNRWIAIRRSFNWYANGFITRFIDAVDDPTSYKIIEAFLDAENMFGNSIVARGDFAGIKMEFSIDDNPRESILAGRIKFKEKIAPFIPTEYIENEVSFDPNMIVNALGGNN